MQEEKKLLSNTIFFFLDWVSMSLLSFIFWAFLAKILSATELGIVSTSTNLIIIFSMFSTLGVSSALVKLIPETARKKGITSVYSLVKLSFKPTFLSIIGITFFLFLFSPQLSSIFNIPYDAMNISAISLFFYSLFGFFGSVLYGLQNIKKLFLTNTFSVFVKLLLSLIFILIGMSYFGPLLGLCMGYAITMLFRIDLNYFKGGNSIPSIKKIFHYAIPAMTASIAGAMVIYSQYMILSSFQNPNITGIYTVAFTISSVITVISSIFSSALFPIISELSSESKTRAKQSYFITIIFRYALFFTVPISILLLIFSRYAVLLFSEPTKLSAASYIPILVPASILFGLGSNFFSSIYAIGKPKLQRNIIVLTAILFLILSIPSTIYYSATGLSFSYLASCLFYFFASYISLHKYLKFRLHADEIFKVLLSSFLITSFLLIVKPFIRDIFMLLLISFPTALLYLTILFILKFYREEDVRLLKFFGKRVPGGKYLIILSKIIERRLNYKKY